MNERKIQESLKHIGDGDHIIKPSKEKKNTVTIILYLASFRS